MHSKCKYVGYMPGGRLLPAYLPSVCVAPCVLDVSTPYKYFLLCVTTLYGHLLLVDSFTVIVCVTAVEYVLQAGSRYVNAPNAVLLCDIFSKA